MHGGIEMQNNKSKKFAVIANKKARNAQKINNYTERFAQAHLEFDLFLVEPQLLRDTIDSCHQKYPLVLVAGGDGTVRTAAQICAHSPCTLGILPLGTLNHFAKELNLPITPDEMIEAINAHHTKQIDLAKVNEFIFVNNSSIGFYPRFAQKRDELSKSYNKWLSYIPSFFQVLKHHPKYQVSLTNNQLNMTFKTSFLMISNNLYSHKFPLTIERERFDAAELGIYVYKKGKLSLTTIINLLFRRPQDLQIEKTSLPLEIKVQQQTKIRIALDGDTEETNNPLCYSILPGALKVLVKK